MPRYILPRQGQRDALDEGIRLAVVIARAVAFDRGVEHVAHEVYVALDGPGAVAFVLDAGGDFGRAQVPPVLQEAVDFEDAPEMQLGLAARLSYGAGYSFVRVELS